jgi:hypothetical protein
MDHARYARQILLAEVGEEGQRRIGGGTARVGGDTAAHEIASLYARRAGCARIEPGQVGVDDSAPTSIATTLEARYVLAGARAALAELRRSLETLAPPNPPPRGGGPESSPPLGGGTEGGLQR